MWDKNFCSLLFIGIYNQLFWLENRPLENDAKNDHLKNIKVIDKKEKADKLSLKTNYNYDFVETVKSLSNSGEFEFKILESDLENLEIQFSIWQEKNKDFDILLGKVSNDWDKTLITTKSILAVIYLEFCNLETTKNPIIINKFIAKYLKIAQNYIDNKNVSLVHAITTKIYPEFNLNLTVPEICTED